jgi:sugar phosphate isomerase/epimerase
MLSITTDYVRSTGDPEPYLRRIAEAGFSHIHWCHQWNTDFLYSQYEIDQIAAWLAGYGLRMLDIHASRGKEKTWGAFREYARLAGVELVKNRIHMAADLESDVIIMHLPDPPEAENPDQSAWLTPLRRSLDELAPFAEERGVKIAIENMGNDNFKAIDLLFSEYGPDFLGLCYDSGHGNIDQGRGLDYLDQYKDRLISIHLHDNDGCGDHHNLLFSGTVDWAQLSRILAESSYQKPISMELSMKHSGIDDERLFLEKAFETGETFSRMVAECRGQGHRSPEI